MVYRPQKYQSSFSYGLGRPYPFRWFTPLAITLCLAVVILFSIVNIASSGYTLVVLSTTNPNTTLTENTWLKRWPSFVTAKTRATCQPFTIPVKSELFTNNIALTYTLTDVWKVDSDGNKNISSSLIYQNNLLEDCIVHGIDMNFESQDRTAVQLSYSEWGVRVSAYTTCSINNNTPGGPTMFSLTMAYNYVPATVRYGEQKGFLGTMFLSRNQSTQASLYWGESLLSMTWSAACRALQDIGESRVSKMVTKGTLNYRPHPDSTASITDLTFFDLDYQFLTIRPGLRNTFYVPPHGSPADIGSLDADAEFPNIWVTADTLAKAAYSAVLTDLGQMGAPHNLLVDPIQLQHFTANFFEWNQHLANALPGPAVEDYDTLKYTTGVLEVLPSVFALDYICKVPRRKAWANLIVSVLVADLVFLQATWQIYKLAVDYFFVKKIPRSQWCEGCEVSSETVPLRERSSEDLS